MDTSMRYSAPQIMKILGRHGNKSVRFLIMTVINVTSIKDDAAEDVRRQQ
jgi:hypothetical protein